MKATITQYSIWKRLESLALAAGFETVVFADATIVDPRSERLPVFVVKYGQSILNGSTTTERFHCMAFAKVLPDRSNAAMVPSWLNQRLKDIHNALINDPTFEELGAVSTGQATVLPFNSEDEYLKAQILNFNVDVPDTACWSALGFAPIETAGEGYEGIAPVSFCDRVSSCGVITSMQTNILALSAATGNDLVLSAGTNMVITTGATTTVALKNDILISTMYATGETSMGIGVIVDVPEFNNDAPSLLTRNFFNGRIQQRSVSSLPFVSSGTSPSFKTITISDVDARINHPVLFVNSSNVVDWDEAGFYIEPESKVLNYKMGGVYFIGPLSIGDMNVGSTISTNSSNITALSSTTATNTTNIAALSANTYFGVITVTGTTRTLSITDAGKYIRTTNGSAISITVPPQSAVTWADNIEIIFEQGESGQITIVAGTGVTINTSETLKSYAQYSVMGLKRVGSNTWTLTGEREPA